MLKHDKQGFLVGDLIAGQKEMLDFQQIGVGLWRNIRTDVRAIARVLGARTTNSKPSEPSGRTAGPPSAAPAAARPGTRAATTAARDAAGRFVSSARAVAPNRSARADRQATRASTQAASTAAAAAATAAAATRDGRGRFQGNGGAGGSGSGEGDGPGLGGKIAERLDGIKTALGGLAAGTEQVDPAVAAMHEVKDVVAPFGRGMFAMLGRSAEKKKERWYKRLLAALTGRKDAPAQGGAAGGEPSMATGAMAGAMARFLPMILTGLGALLGGGVALFLGTKLGTALYDWLDKSGIATKVFDAFDAAVDWIKDKVAKGKAAIENYGAARDIARAGGLDASGRSLDDPRRLDRPGGVSGAAGRIVGSIHRGRDYMAGEGGRTAIEARALRTGSEYKAGNIGNLNEAQTRALVASTVATESRGGKLDLVNGAGYMGRYQAGAGWLADAGLLKGGGDAVKSAMKADGFSNEYKWGQSGGMTRFLKNSGNWKDGLSYDKYLGSAELQDGAFKTNSDVAYRDMVKRGMVGPNTPPAEVAGLLKARHLAGMGGASAVAAGGTGPADANGTTARKYFDDVARDRGGFLAAYSGSAATAGIARPASVSVPSSVPDKMPAAAAVEIPPGAGQEKDKPVRAVMREPIGQDVGDRKIAHIVSGGIGG